MNNKIIITTLLIASLFVLATQSCIAGTEDNKLGLHSDGGPWRFYPNKDSASALPKVLLIGDSIMNGYRGKVASILKDKANVDVWLTPLHLNSPELHHDLQKVMQQGPYDVIHFNIGLHGWTPGRIPEGQYDPLMDAYVQILLSHSDNVKLIWGSTTQITVKGKPLDLDPVNNKTIVKRNVIAAEVMSRYGIPVNDLYGLMSDKLSLARGDGFHWNGQAYQLMAEKISQNIIKSLHSSKIATPVFFVSAAGNDANPGTKEKPFATLQASRNVIRRLKAKDGLPDGGVTVYLRGGIYSMTVAFELDGRDSGESDKRIVYRAFGDEQVSLIGGEILDVGAFKQVSDAGVLKRLPKQSLNNVLQIDLKTYGLTDYGEHMQYGHALPVCPAPMELFFGDDAMPLARYPNKGYISIGKVIDPGSNPRNGDYKNIRGGTFGYINPRHERWSGVEDIWFQGTFNNGYADDKIKVESINTTKHTVKLATPHMYSVTGGASHQHYVALNLLEELDEPGEWYIDRKIGMLYFWPPSDIAKSKIAVSLLEDPIVSMEGVSYVTLRDLTIEIGRGTGVYIERGKCNLIAGCTVRNIGTSGVFMGQGARQTFPHITHDDYEGVPVARRVGSLQGQIYKYTTWDRKAGEGHGVVGCDVYNTGCGGICLSGGSKKDLIAGNCYVDNTVVHDYNRRNKFLWSGINIDGCGNRIAHCEIYNSDWQGIYAHGNEHVFEYNNIHHVTMHSDDTSPWYLGRDPSDRGNVLRYNFFHHCGRPGGFNMGIYCDDSTGGVTVEGNVFYKMFTKHGVIFSNAGHDHVVRNNIFLDCEGPAVMLSSMWYTWGTRFFGYYFDKNEGLFPYRLTELVNIKKPPYSTRYPELVDWLDTIEGSKEEFIGMRPRRNIMENNVVSGCTNKLIMSGNHAQFEDRNNLVTNDDLGFVNESEMDFRLKKDSVVFEKIPGFKPIPFEKIGLYVDEYRKALP
jgi:hypothetical protein